MVTFIIVIAVVVVGLVLLFSLALASAAGWGDENQREGSPLAILGSLRSPNGRPFFASRRAVRELVDEIEGLGNELPRVEGRTADQPAANETSSTQSLPRPP